MATDQLENIPSSKSETPAAALVREFNEAFENPKDPALWRSLIREETAEVTQAAANLLKELCDLVYVMEGAQWAGVDIETLGAQTLANILVLFRLYGKAFSDAQFTEAFKRVHASNMSKLVDGKPLRREDGKVLKGPNYKAPDLIDII